MMSGFHSLPSKVTNLGSRYDVHPYLPTCFLNCLRTTLCLLILLFLTYRQWPDYVCKRFILAVTPSTSFVRTRIAPGQGRPCRIQIRSEKEAGDKVSRFGVSVRFDPGIGYLVVLEVFNAVPLAQHLTPFLEFPLSPSSLLIGRL
ncbi:hypothetical protein chiPu_0022480 [Chiloscyllium punctatum]|uniref:Uncharacterized protein n=1 Tax=Chiloscyllium punctatum TaxID=137246 RepID=A0A401RGY3_CHIPU|nr:hypothetical protein [Chiloscyllium punctatum]